MLGSGTFWRWPVGAELFGSELLSKCSAMSECINAFKEIFVRSFPSNHLLVDNITPYQTCFDTSYKQSVLPLLKHRDVTSVGLRWREAYSL